MRLSGDKRGQVEGADAVAVGRDDVVLGRDWVDREGRRDGVEGHRARRGRAATDLERGMPRLADGHEPGGGEVHREDRRKVQFEGAVTRRQRRMHQAHRPGRRSRVDDRVIGHQLDVPVAGVAVPRQVLGQHTGQTEVPRPTATRVRGADHGGPGAIEVRATPVDPGRKLVVPGRAEGQRAHAGAPVGGVPAHHQGDADERPGRAARLDLEVEEWRAGCLGRERRALATGWRKPVRGIQRPGCGIAEVELHDPHAEIEARRVGFEAAAIPIVGEVGEAHRQPALACDQVARRIHDQAADGCQPDPARRDRRGIRGGEGQVEVVADGDLVVTARGAVRAVHDEDGVERGGLGVRGGGRRGEDGEDQDRDRRRGEGTLDDDARRRDEVMHGQVGPQGRTNDRFGTVEAWRALVRGHRSSRRFRGAGTPRLSAASPPC